MAKDRSATMVTGASGYLGSHVAGALLVDGRRLVLALRQLQDGVIQAVRASVLRAMGDLGVPEAEAQDSLAEVRFVPMPGDPADGGAGDLADVDEVVHCAGCVDYFDERLLRAGNVDLTVRLLDFARTHRVNRFVYLSTAYCSGYRAGRIEEHLHAEPRPEDEPTAYTKTKRAAERQIAESGVPFVIVRPSVVIGDSRTGLYAGKNYGLYQMWRAIEGLLCREFYPVWYTVAPPITVNFVHEDAFVAGFRAVYRECPPGTIMHLVSGDAVAPTMRDLCTLWLDVYNPLEVHAYRRVDDVPLKTIPSRQRRFLELAATNFEISARRWDFESKVLDGLRARGLDFVDATLETIARCQRRYIETSPRIQDHMRRYRDRPGGAPRMIDMYADTPTPRRENAA